MHLIGFICISSILFCGFNEPHYFYIIIITKTLKL